MNKNEFKNLKEKKAKEKDTYFSKLKFNPKEFGLFSWGYLNNIRIVILFVILLVVGGVFSFLNVPRNLNPEVEIPIVFISTMLPGASSQDVESLITIPIEDKIESIEGIDTLTSTSTEGRSGVTIQFQSDVKLSEAEIDVQTAVDSVGDLPENATDPMVTALDFENQPIWTFSLVSNIDDVSLVRFSQELKDEIENLSKINRVSTSGLESQEVQIKINPGAMDSLGVNVMSLSQTIQEATASHPIGTANSSDSSFSISLDPTVTSIEDLRKLDVSINGNKYVLSEIANVLERPAPEQANAYLLEEGGNVKKAVTFNIYRNTSERIDLAFEEAENLVNEKISKQEGRFEIRSIYSTAEEIEKQFGSLFRNFSITIGLVFFVLLLFFGIRQALIASLAIPFSFLFSFIAMQLSSISLNFLSMFSLLISLGLLVDVTIVVVSAITSYYKTGKFSPTEAGLLVWRDYRITLLVTTLTTVWAFSPLLLSTGIIGEFIFPIPIVVSATLIGSLVVGLFITLPFMMVFLKPFFPRRVKIFLGLISLILLTGLMGFVFRDSQLVILIVFMFLVFILVTFLVRENISRWVNGICGKGCVRKFKKGIAEALKNGIVSFQSLGEYYQMVIERIIYSRKARIKTLSAIVIFFVFSFALVPAGFVVNEFFPKEDVDFFYVNVELPAGTKLEVTKKEALRLADELKDTPYMEALQVQIGAKIGPDGSVSSSSGLNTILYTLTFVPEEERDFSSNEIAEKVRKEFASYGKGEFSVVELSGGPPAGADVVITFLGSRLENLNQYADETVAYLEKQSGITNIEKSVESGASKIVFVVDEDKLADLGITRSQISSALRVFSSGFEMDGDVKFSGISEERDVVLRNKSEAVDISSLGLVNVSGKNMSVFSLGDFKMKINPSEIIREDGKRSLSVSASVKEGYSSSVINSELENFADSLEFPAEYSWKTGGANEENQKSVQSILQAMVLAFVLIMATLVIQLGSYRKALIVMLVIPLALSGVFVIFAITGTPLSFPALIGVLALFGIVVNNSIILVDKINLNLRAKMNLIDSISDAAASRLEPIALGSLTTIIGLTPITLSDPLWQGLGGAIIAGLLFSGIIMLFFIPVVYYSWFHKA